MPDCYPTGSIVRVLSGAARGTTLTGTVVGCYAYEVPIFIVRTRDGLLELPATSLELVVSGRNDRRRGWFSVEV
jgi:hypothetical protein